MRHFVRAIAAEEVTIAVSKVILAVLTAVGLGACASAPPTETPVASASAPTAVAPTPGHGVATSQENSDNSFPGTFTRRSANGVTLYCRKEEVAGTRIPQLVCATEHVMRAREEESRRMIDEARTTSGLGGCNPAASC